MADSQRFRVPHRRSDFEVPSLVLDLKWEVSLKEVNGPSIAEHIWRVFVRVSGDVSCAKCGSQLGREVHASIDFHLTACWQSVEGSDKPWVRVLHQTANLTLLIHSRFSSRISFQSWTQSYCRATVGFERRHSCAVVRKLDLNSSFPIDGMRDIESDQNLDVFLADVEFVVWA